MAQKKQASDGYSKLAGAIKANMIGSFYIFHGDERYLLERSLGDLRRQLCPDGLDGFNYKRYDNRNVSIDDFENAIDTLPAFADRTLIELHDFDIFKHEQKQRLADILSGLPDYVCVVFIYDTIDFKPDGRVKLNTEILKHAEVLEFALQDQEKLINWICRHAAGAGKRISTAEAEYLALITGGYMSQLHGEIEKTAAYAKGETITRADIDAVVTPVLDAVSYKLTDALARRDNKNAMRILDELLRMREAPHKLLFSISLKMRQILAARVCYEDGSGKDALMEICGIRHEFMARSLFDTAKKAELADCANAVLSCAKTALMLNTSSRPEDCLKELVARLAFTAQAQGF